MSSLVNIKTNNAFTEVIADSITNNINIDGHNGAVDLKFNKEPINMLLELKNNNSYSIPKGWNKTTLIGTGEPTITISNPNGTINVKVK